MNEDELTAAFAVFRRFGINEAWIELLSHDEAIFVVPARETGQLREGPITRELTKRLRRKVWVRTG